MVKFIDNRQREEEILALLVDCYIKESRPISSAHLCEKCHLNYSPATVRNVMVVLEKQGYLSHIHTSSGRIPTQEGFRRYVEHITGEGAEPEGVVDSDMDVFFELDKADEAMNNALDVLAETSGYTSLFASFSDNEEKILFRGTRFMLQQPEFEDVQRLRDIFYLLEVRMDMLRELLFGCIDEKIHILIGDDIGFQEVSDCTLIVSGLRENRIACAMALLGPMRMNYSKALSCLRSAKKQFLNILGGIG